MNKAPTKFGLGVTLPFIIALYFAAIMLLIQDGNVSDAIITLLIATIYYIWWLSAYYIIKKSK